MRLDFRMMLHYQSGMQRSWPCLDPATLQRSGEDKTGIARPFLCPILSPRRGVSRISLHFDAHRFFFSSTLKTAPKKSSANSAPMGTSVHS